MPKNVRWLYLTCFLEYNEEKNKHKKMKKIIAGFSLVLLILVQNTAYAYNSSIEAYGVDTVAGFNTVITSSKTYPNVDVSFRIGKPDGHFITIDSRANKNGIAFAELDGYHTAVSGRYTLSAKLKSGKEYGRLSYFHVYSDKTDIEASVIESSKNLLKADGNDEAVIVVKLVDSLNNPINGHYVNLISSRSGDRILKSQLQTTDEDGKISFTVSASEEGISTYSAMDVTEDCVLNDRKQIAYVGEAGPTGGTLDALLKKAYAETSGPIAKFEIHDLPSSINKNENVDFTVTAMDSNGLTVENYVGTIHFSSEGDNSSDAILPEDYTFKPEDLGSHKFSLALRFLSDGEYNMIVNDSSNPLLKGEVTINIGASSGDENTGNASKPVITTPTAGTYSQSQFTINGTADSGKKIKIFDDQTELGEVNSGIDGKFIFQTDSLTSGEHILIAKVAQGDDNTSESDPVIVTIDISAPEVEEIILDPKTEAEPGSVLNIRILSEENLQTAAVIFNGDIFELQPSLEDTTAYVGQIQLPMEEGEYSIDAVLVDQLNNEESYDGVAKIKVVANPKVDEPETPEENNPTEDNNAPAEASLAPSQVTGVVAYGSDMRVTLVWEAANDDSMISKYRIYYGTNPADLSNKVDTRTSATTWYIPELNNGKEYFFSIFALDDEGNESENGSTIVSAIPFTLDVETNLPVRSATPLANDNDVLLKGAAIEGNVPGQLYQNGPEIIWILAASGVFGGISKKILKRNRKGQEDA